MPMIEVQTNESGAHGSRFFVHADAVAIAETGILIRGPSGAGKSRLVLTLISAAEVAGYFARLVGDDRVSLEQCGGRLIARGHPAIHGTIEWREQGIYRKCFLDAVVLGLVIDLVSSEVTLPRCPEEQVHETLAGVSVPAMKLRCNLGPSDLAWCILQHFHFHRAKNLGEATVVGTFP